MAGQHDDMYDRIEKLRIQHGLTKAELYEKSGITASAFSQWRTGTTNPSMRSINKLAEVLNTTAELLMFGEKKEPSPVQGGLTSQQLELIALVAQLSDEDAAVLAAAAKAQIASHKAPGDQ